jgi:hypothetical protein
MDGATRDGATWMDSELWTRSYMEMVCNAWREADLRL